MGTSLGDVFDFVDQANEHQIREIINAVVERQKVLRRRKEREVRSQIKVGSTVKFGTNCKPKYLNHQRAKVLEIQQSRVLVELEKGPMGKFRSGRVLAHFASLILVED